MLFLLLFSVAIAHSQESRTEIFVDFRVNSAVIDSTYSNNAARLQEIIDLLGNIRQDSTINIIEISFCGAASPEGSDQLNRKLARGRLTALEEVIRKEVDIPESLITRNDSYIPWTYLKSQIEDSDLMRKEEVIAILEEEALLVDYHHPNTHIDNRIVKLMQLDNGEVWKQMNKLFFEGMRNACVVFVTFKKALPPTQDVPTIVPDVIMEEPEPVVEVAEIVPDTTAVIETIVPEIEDWNRKMYLKTNLVGLGAAIANLSFEVDLGKHWSFTLPIYYSAWDYFKPTLKFRTLATQPEFRFWFLAKNDGFFVGAHYSMAYYNFAFDGRYRYQDRNGNTPVMSGGLSVGYRFPISRNERWKMELSVGGGYYFLNYDVFQNVPNGEYSHYEKRKYLGVDQASLSIAYMLNRNKKSK